MGLGNGQADEAVENVSRSVVSRDSGGGSDLVVHRGAEDREASVTDPMLAMINRALSDPNVSIEKLECVIAIADERRAVSAKRSFNADFAMMQAALPVVDKGGTGHNRKRYARQEDIVRAVRPTLAKHGFAISHRISQDNSAITVVSVLSHRDGHSEQTALKLPPDKSGGKTDVHATASAVTYATRYTTIALLGIASSEDDDGKAAGTDALITDDQEEALREAITSARADIDRFLKFYQIESLSDLPASKFAAAMKMIEVKKSKGAA